MCISCGCSSAQAHLETDANLQAPAKDPARDAGAAAAGWHRHADGRWHTHSHADAGLGPGHAHDHEHDHAHGHAHQHEHDHAHGHAHQHEHEHDPHPHPSAGDGPEAGAARLVQVERDVLAKNDAIAAGNRRRLAQAGSLALNLVSSPGAGKTTLLCRTIESLGRRVPVVVVEGDQQTSIDADRIRATGVPALQVNTGKGCHLDAAMIERALAQLDTPDQSLVLIENVGNLVCPAAFDLGEDAKVVVLSVTEGDDKPLKYPDMFAAAQLMLINKIDLQPYCDFDPARALAFARRANPAIEMIPVSARDGRGLPEWLAWIHARHAAKTARAAVAGDVVAAS
jgi:hydrogenase nickel incorporation protein HypB